MRVESMESPKRDRPPSGGLSFMRSLHRKQHRRSHTVVRLQHFGVRERLHGNRAVSEFVLIQ